MARATFEAKLLKVRHHRPGKRTNTKMEAMLQIPGYKIPVWTFLPESFLEEATRRRMRGDSCKEQGSIVSITGRMEVKARTARSGWLHEPTIDLDSVRWHTPGAEPQWDQE